MTDGTERPSRPTAQAILLGLAVLGGVSLRLMFVFRFPAITPDGRLYLAIAETWARHGVYGADPATPSFLRMPGYPAFLAAFHLVTGAIVPKAVFLAQALVDLATCVVVGGLAFVAFGRRAGRIAFVLALLCPFTANYVALVLTETLAILTTALALLGATLVLDRLGERLPVGVLVATGAAVGAGLLLRPDAGILLMAIPLVFLTRVAEAGWKRILAAGAIVGAVSLAPLVPWTIRNAVSFGVFQPLTPSVIVGKRDRVPVGFTRWVSTWILDYVSDQEVWWKVFSREPIDPAHLPARALDSPGDPARTLALIREFNGTKRVSESLDRRFEELAADRIRDHPIRHFVLLPLGRMADMWLRPRTEMLPLDSRWWEFRNPKSSWISIGYAALNVALLALAARGALLYSRSPAVWLFVGFAVVRTAVLATAATPASPEARYTLECYPGVLALAAAAIAGDIRWRRRTTPA